MSRDTSKKITFMAWRRNDTSGEGKRSVAGHIFVDFGDEIHSFEGGGTFSWLSKWSASSRRGLNVYRKGSIAYREMHKAAISTLSSTVLVSAEEYAKAKRESLTYKHKSFEALFRNCTDHTQSVAKKIGLTKSDVGISYPHEVIKNIKAELNNRPPKT